MVGWLVAWLQLAPPPTQSLFLHQATVALKKKKKKKEGTRLNLQRASSIQAPIFLPASRPSPRFFNCSSPIHSSSPPVFFLFLNSTGGEKETCSTPNHPTWKKKKTKKKKPKCVKTNTAPLPRKCCTHTCTYIVAAKHYAHRQSMQNVNRAITIIYTPPDPIPATSSQPAEPPDIRPAQLLYIQSTCLCTVVGTSSITVASIPARPTQHQLTRLNFLDQGPLFLLVTARLRKRKLGHGGPSILLVLCDSECCRLFVDCYILWTSRPA